jgi:hypothetical protein
MLFHDIFSLPLTVPAINPMRGLQARRSAAYASVRQLPAQMTVTNVTPPALSVHRQTTAVENLAQSAMKNMRIVLELRWRL